MLTARQIRTNAVVAGLLLDMGVLSAFSCCIRSSLMVIAVSFVFPRCPDSPRRTFRIDSVPLRVGTAFLLGLSFPRRAPVRFAEMRKVRRSHTKSRKGCLQCKNGHVKVSGDFYIASFC